MTEFMHGGYLTELVRVLLKGCDWMPKGLGTSHTWKCHRWREGCP
jgi:hypothetical protein